jgi:hypothetical protein
MLGQSQCSLATLWALSRYIMVLLSIAVELFLSLPLSFNLRGIRALQGFSHTIQLSAACRFGDLFACTHRSHVHLL